MGYTLAGTTPSEEYGGSGAAQWDTKGFGSQGRLPEDMVSKVTLRKLMAKTEYSRKMKLCV